LHRSSNPIELCIERIAATVAAFFNLAWLKQRFTVPHQPSMEQDTFANGKQP